MKADGIPDNDEGDDGTGRSDAKESPNAASNGKRARLLLPKKTKPIAPGTIIFHPGRGYGVLTAVNLLTGWVSARFGHEVRTLDLSLSEDGVQHADGEAIRFRRAAPDFMPHARLMHMVRVLHSAGYERLYLYTWPKPSGLHWRWQLFAGRRDWVHRPLRNGWYGSGSDYAMNPVMGWGDNPGATAEELASALAAFDPEGLAQALGSGAHGDAEYVDWFAAVCDALLPTHAFSLGWEHLAGSALQSPSKRVGGPRSMPASLPVMAVRRGVPADKEIILPWPPGWVDGWAHHGYERALRHGASL